MDASTSLETHHDPHAHAAEHEHHELGWWRKYVFSTDHKVIGIQYGFTGLIFLFFGFSLMMLMRWQLAYPGQALPVIGKLLPHIFGAGSMPDGKMTPDFYNTLGAMHGTIMVFLGIVPLAFAAVADTGPAYNPVFNGQTLWLIGFIFLSTSSLLGAINFIATIIQLRAKGLTWMRLPFFVWAQFVTAFLLLLAFPPLDRKSV